MKIIKTGWHNREFLGGLFSWRWWRQYFSEEVTFHLGAEGPEIMQLLGLRLAGLGCISEFSRCFAADALSLMTPSVLSPASRSYLDLSQYLAQRTTSLYTEWMDGWILDKWMDCVLIKGRTFSEINVRLLNHHLHDHCHYDLHCYYHLQSYPHSLMYTNTHIGMYSWNYN